MRKKSRIFARRSSGKTADGDLYVFFWNPDKDYFLHTESEMDAYIPGMNGQHMGGM